MSPNRGCARRGGPAAWSGWRPRVIIIGRKAPPTGGSGWSSALSPCRTSHPRWGYRLIHQLLCREGWTVNRKRVQRVRRQAGLGIPPVERRKRRPRSARRTPVQAAYPGHVWSWDFILDRTTDGRPVKMLTVVDEYTRQCLVIHPARSIPSDHVLDTLQALVEAWGAPAFMRSDNGSGIYRPAHSGLVRYRRHPDALYRAG